MMDTVSRLEQRLTELEAYQAEMTASLEKMRQVFAEVKKKQIRTGPLAPLAKALAYHHSMVNGWDGLALRGGSLLELHTEFVQMRQVVIHYEYVAQCLLGINPSPLTDLENE